MKQLIQIEKYFKEIKDDTNICEMVLVDSLPSKEKVQLYKYLEKNNALFAGGELLEVDLIKVRNVMIRLWLKANENNKKYGKNHKALPKIGE